MCSGDNPQHPPIIWTPSSDHLLAADSNASGFIILSNSFDLLCVIIRRILRKINPLRPDRRHLHHLLIKKYKNQTKVLILINSYSIFSSILGGFCFYFFGPGPALMVFFFWFVIYLLLSILISRSLSYE